ncbi:hypothetical protein HPB51_014248 [Rhipicephalus microplus]|uniref:Uncharacterized protein n=1 Tax=Rhipicephalus microplus TaxID=6941 RepID=A0A9J6D614_RHIMP|nr:hypothetical protein HPB51_014248 [Rhipicephalus microplus]
MIVGHHCCRYIPVGLLEVLPQKINERPPPYRGRDDLETLFASPSCADWLKISSVIVWHGHLSASLSTSSSADSPSPSKTSATISLSLTVLACGNTAVNCEVITQEYISWHDAHIAAVLLFAGFLIGHHTRIGSVVHEAAMPKASSLRLLQAVRCSTPKSFASYFAFFAAGVGAVVGAAGDRGEAIPVSLAR